MKSNKLNLLVILLLLVNSISLFSQVYNEDSLLKIVGKNVQDTNLAKTFNALSRHYIDISEYEKALEYGEKSLSLASKLKFEKLQVKSLKNIGSVYLLLTELNKANNYYTKALNLANKINDKIEIANILGNMGSVYYYQGNYAEAVAYYLKQMALVEKSGDKRGLSKCYGNLGNTYNFKADYPNALHYLLKQRKLAEELNDPYSISNCYNNIALVYVEMQMQDKALELFNKSLEICIKNEIHGGAAVAYLNLGILDHKAKRLDAALKLFEKSLELAEKIGDITNISKAKLNIGSVNLDLKNYKEAREYLNEALQLSIKSEDKYAATICYNNIAKSFEDCNDFNNAIKYYLLAVSEAEKYQYSDILKQTYDHLSVAYYQNSRYKEAFEYVRKFKRMTDSIFNIENSKIISDIKTNFEVEKKQAELMAISKVEKEKLHAIREKEKEQHRFVIIVVLFGLILVTVFAVIIFNRFKLTQKQKTVIELKELETQQQKHLLEEKNKEITDSITYAQRLQQAILPPLTLIKKYLPQSFVLYKPKDIVAGDFYWMETFTDANQSENVLIAAADCTGHGVPGAMVSIVCSAALNRSVNEFKITDTGKILDKTRELVVETFAKSESEVKDGMDISLCSINLNTKQISWSGANNPFWYFQNGNLKEIKAHKQPIGKVENASNFPTHQFQLETGNTIYLITDGLADQFGGPKGKKYKYSQLISCIANNQDKDMETQKNILDTSFNNWKGELEQVDDVCIIGIRI